MLRIIITSGITPPKLQANICQIMLDRSFFWRMLGTKLFLVTLILTVPHKHGLCQSHYRKTGPLSPSLVHSWSLQIPLLGYLLRIRVPLHNLNAMYILLQGSPKATHHSENLTLHAQLHKAPKGWTFKHLRANSYVYVFWVLAKIEITMRTLPDSMSCEMHVDLKRDLGPCGHRSSKSRKRTCTS